MGIPPDELLALASSLTSGLAGPDRYAGLLDAIARIMPCDAAAVLRLERGALVPVAWRGLVPEVAGCRFHPHDHPRLAAILAAAAAGDPPPPVRFPADSPLPDPWDGMMLGDPHACARVHACMGAPLVVAGSCVGCISVDAIDPSAFEAIADGVLGTFAALAAAVLHTAGLIEQLERLNRRQSAVLRRLAEERDRAVGRLLGTGAAMQRLRREIDLVAGSDLAVLITGETGTGKELVAQAVHAASARAGEPLVSINCAALPEHLVESQIFGHLRGAFTGAAADRAGLFEIADGGTVFLDEVGELPLAVQAKLLRTLQQGEIQRLGAERPQRVDVRVIAATNRDLAAEQAAGRFRSDLYYRLAVYPLDVPPLRERREDIPLISGAILEREARRLGLPGLRLDAAARGRLAAAEWPGNIRELEHVLMRAAVRAAASGATVIGDGLLDLTPAGPGHDTADPAAPSEGTQAADPRLRNRVDAFQRAAIDEALARHHGVWAAAARELGLTPSNLQRLARRLAAQDS